MYSTGFIFGVVLVLRCMFWKHHIILCDSRIDMYCLLHVRGVGVVLVLRCMFWKHHIILCDSRIDMYCLLHVRVLDVLVDLSRIFSVTY